MKIRADHRRSGIALIMVMIIVVVFATLAGLLAYSMKVETTLARNASWDTELQWIGRSGIEYAKFLLTPCGGPAQQYDALNQKWAGGTADTNDCFMGMSLKDVPIGHGRFSLTIKDADSKFNINLAAAMPEIVNQGLILMGVDAAEAPHIVNAIADWTDRDDDPRVGSTDTESDYYMSLNPPYRAKDGPIDDLTELMMIKGITPAMYYGSGGGAAAPPGMRMSDRFNSRFGEESAYPIGFVDLFTTISGRFININTASANVMQLIPDVDGNLAQAIITARNGPDGAEGTEDDMPFRSIGEVANVPGMTRDFGQLFSRYFSTRSSTFEVQVDCEIDAVKRTYYAVLRRNGNQVLTLFMYWR
jgi:general secretion pathway protein K